MTTIESGTSYTVKFNFNSEYGTITESDFSLLIDEDGTKTMYDDTSTLFTVVQPVASTSNGSITATLTAPSSSQFIKIGLYKGTTDSVLQDELKIKILEISTSAVSTNTL